MIHKIIEIQIRRILIFFGFALLYPSDENIRKLTGFSLAVVNQQETEERAARKSVNSFLSLWPCTRLPWVLKNEESRILYKVVEKQRSLT